MDFPTKETSVGSWFGFTGGMCTTAQYFEVDGVILDFEQLVLGWMDSTHGAAGKVPQYFTKTTRGCVWSSQINTGGRHGKEMAVRVVHKVRGTWQGHEVAFYIALGLGYLPW